MAIALPHFRMIILQNLSVNSMPRKVLEKLRIYVANDRRICLASVGSKHDQRSTVSNLCTTSANHFSLFLLLHYSGTC